MMTPVQSLPEGLKLSKSLEDEIDAGRGKRVNRYLRLPMFGHNYYIPLTKNIRKAFGITGKEAIICGESDGAIRDIAHALLEQVKAYAVAEATASVSQDVMGMVENVLAQRIGREIAARTEQKMLPAGSATSPCDRNDEKTGGR